MNRRAVDDISLKRLLWMAGIVIGASLPHWPTLPLWIPLLLITSVAWRLAGRLAGAPLPNRAFRLLFVLSALFAVLAQYRTINGLNAGSALLVVMIALKFLETSRQRDQLVLIMISYFLVFAGLLYQSSFVTGAYVIGFAWLTTVGLLQLGRRGDLMRNGPTAKLAGRLLVQATPIMIVLFLLFPRLPGPLWAIPGTATSGTSGLSDSMSPGDITELGLSDEVAFRVDFHGQPPRAEDLYWRGPVLTHFNGRTWTRREGIWQRAETTLRHSGEPVEYRVMLEPQRQAWIFALDMPARWSAPGRQNIGMQSDYQLRAFFRNSSASRFDYEVTSYTDYTAMEPLNASEKALYLELPEGFNPRTRAMTAEWRAEGLSAGEIIERALSVFRDNGFFYTLTPPPLGVNSVDDFIFETKEGFCEHYASAFTIMMRAAGIPARVVTGYQGGELNSLGSYYIIRQSNAHAWTEVWLENRGWVRVDPIVAVAPERISLGSSSSALDGSLAPGSAFSRISWLRDAALAWDAVNTYWHDWIVNYGPQLQRALLESLGFERPRWGQMFAIAIAATTGCLTLLAAYSAWQSRRRGPADPAEQLFAKFARQLRRVKVAPRTASEGPVAFGNRAARSAPTYAEPIERIVHAYLRARYEPDAQGRGLAELRALVGEFRPARSSA